MSNHQKGNSLVFVLLGVGIAVVVIGGAYLLKQHAMNKIPPVDTTAILPTTAPTLTLAPQPTASVSGNPTPTLVPKTLTYQLPSGWSNVTDSTGAIQVGYDPTVEGPVPGDSLINFSGTYQGNPQQYVGYKYSVGLRTYYGFSRRQFLFDYLKVSDANPYWENSKFSTQEYSYDGWNCLVFYGVNISQLPASEGVCQINATQAMLFGVDGDQALTEKVIQTIRLLK